MVPATESDAYSRCPSPTCQLFSVYLAIDRALRGDRLGYEVSTQSNEKRIDMLTFIASQTVGPA